MTVHLQKATQYYYWTAVMAIIIPSCSWPNHNSDVVKWSLRGSALDCWPHLMWISHSRRLTVSHARCAHVLSCWNLTEISRMAGSIASESEAHYGSTCHWFSPQDQRFSVHPNLDTSLSSSMTMVLVVAWLSRNALISINIVSSYSTSCPVNTWMTVCRWVNHLGM